VRRLEESLTFGPEHVRRVLQTVAALMMAVERRTGERATEDKATFAALQMALAGYFGLPFGEKGVDAKARKIGETIARDALRRSGVENDGIKEWLVELAKAIKE
jgi:hypothetical protein